jgi:hypothetical protein
MNPFTRILATPFNSAPQIESFMADDIEFIDGFFAKAPHENAPEFVKAKVNIKREELLSWLTSRSDEWISVDIKEARSGKWYASVDNWQPNGGGEAQPNTAKPAPFFADEDGLDTIPFDDGPTPDFDDDSVPF